MLSCFKIEAAEGIRAKDFAARQGAILDFGPDIRFSKILHHVNIEDGGKASCTGKIYIEGSAIVFASASDLSMLNLDCPSCSPLTYPLLTSYNPVTEPA